MDLSIIVPVYNVEKYVRACLESIFRQGLDEDRFEVIIVNDGTRDRSMEMIADIIGQHKNITVINQENQGLSVARNNGVKAAKGDYIIMPDSDDLLIADSLPTLLKPALETKADLVMADFLMLGDEEIERYQPPVNRTLKIQEKTCTDLFLEDYTPYESYVWRTLYRREFLLENNIWSYPGILFQDVPFTHECCLKAKKCIRASWLLNIYRTGHASATYNFDKKKADDFCIAMRETWKLCSWEGHTPETLRKLKDDVFVSFSHLIILISYSFKRRVDRWVTIKFIQRNLNHVRFDNGFRQRAVSLLFKYIPITFIEANYYLRRLLRLFK